MKLEVVEGDLPLACESGPSVHPMSTVCLNTLRFAICTHGNARETKHKQHVWEGLWFCTQISRNDVVNWKTRAEPPARACLGAPPTEFMLEAALTDPLPHSLALSRMQPSLSCGIVGFRQACTLLTWVA